MLLYVMHPRDAFITKIRLLHDARESKNVRSLVDNRVYTLCAFAKFVLLFAQPASLECVRELVAHLPDWLNGYNKDTQ